MFAVLSMKAVRLLLSVSVSIWIAGGCLFGCTGTVASAEQTAPAEVESQSCHAAHQKTKAPSAPNGMPSFAPAPRGMMTDCPLAVSATAATSKNSSHVPDPARGPVSALPLIEKTIAQSNTSLVVGFLPNRGPTYLRCCVFLI